MKAKIVGSYPNFIAEVLLPKYTYMKKPIGTGIGHISRTKQFPIIDAHQKDIRDGKFNNANVAGKIIEVKCQYGCGNSDCIFECLHPKEMFSITEKPIKKITPAIMNNIMEDSGKKFKVGQVNVQDIIIQSNERYISELEDKIQKLEAENKKLRVGLNLMLDTFAPITTYGHRVDVIANVKTLL